LGSGQNACLSREENVIPTDENANSRRQSHGRLREIVA
jgi:hypothetical protein